ncbi:MAG: aminotransferase class I/II-fold pyridoxal phosphate-dependent enzyme [Eubacteriales bacterium]
MPPSGIRKFFDVASTRKDCISLGIGEPDFVTPWNIRERAIYAIERGETHYTSNWGSPKLRLQIAAYLQLRTGVSYAEKEILVTTGASEALDLAFRSLLNGGEEILIPAPSYVSYMPNTILAGGVPVPLQVVEENKFKITRDLLKAAITKNTKAIVIPYPNNPTGAIMTKEDLLDIADVIKENDLIVIADEIYSELTYGRKHFSIVSIPGMRERTILINGFSKAFAMTGWRLGYVAGPVEILSAMCKIHQYTMLCASTISQAAGYEAIKYEMENDFPQVTEMLIQYDRRRKFIYNSFNEMGLKCFEAEGAFYVFPNITSTGLSSEEFCSRLLFEKNVACVPGDAFGEAGEGYIRCSYASSIENIEEALNRIREFLQEI